MLGYNKLEVMFLTLLLFDFQAYCHYQEAALHLRHVLELKPNYGPALAALQDMDSIPDSSVHVYTMVPKHLLICLSVVFLSFSLSPPPSTPQSFCLSVSLLSSFPVTSKFYLQDSFTNVFYIYIFYHCSFTA
jgi:hypothetical protein